MEQYLTAKELSERIKYSAGTIRNMVWNGTLRKGIHYVQPTPRKVLFIWSAIEAWLFGGSSTGSGNRDGNLNTNTSLINI